jgi:hypothetical protein
MQQIARELPLHTGGEFFILGVWSEDGNTPKFFQ